MDLIPWISGLCGLVHMFGMNEALKLVNEKLQEDLEDQLDSRRAQANSHIAKGRSDADRVRKETEAKIDTVRKEDEELIQEGMAAIDLKGKYELKYQETLKSLKELENDILKKKIENENREDTSPEYKLTKLNNFISTLLIHACKELLDEVYNGATDSAYEMRLQMAASTYHYYTLRMELYYLSKSGAASEMGTLLDLDDNAPLYKVIPKSLSCFDGIDVKSAIVRQNFDGSVTLELCQLNYTDNSGWLLALLLKIGSNIDFVKVTNKEGFSALKANFLAILVAACDKYSDAFLDGVPRHLSIGFCPSLDWDSELFEFFESHEESMILHNRRNIANGAFGYVADVKHKGEAMKLIVYVGFEQKEEPFKKINCFEMFRVPDPDNDTSQ